MFHRAVANKKKKPLLTSYGQEDKEISNHERRAYMSLMILTPTSNIVLHLTSTQQLQNDDDKPGLHKQSFAAKKNTFQMSRYSEYLLYEIRQWVKKNFIVKMQAV